MKFHNFAFYQKDNSSKFIKKLATLSRKKDCKQNLEMRFKTFIRQQVKKKI